MEFCVPLVGTELDIVEELEDATPAEPVIMVWFADTAGLSPDELEPLVPGTPAAWVEFVVPMRPTAPDWLAAPVWFAVPSANLLLLDSAPVMPRALGWLAVPPLALFEPDVPIKLAIMAWAARTNIGRLNCAAPVGPAMESWTADPYHPITPFEPPVWCTLTVALEASVGIELAGRSVALVGLAIGVVLDDK